MKKLLIFISFLLSLPCAFSQTHYGGFSQYMFNGLVINPAYAGSREVMSTSLMYRKQWLGIEDAPESTSLSWHFPVPKLKLGLGLFAMMEQEDIQKRTQIFGNFAYQLMLGKGKLALGLKAGILFQNSDLSKVISQLDDPTDPYFSDRYPQNKTFINFGAGAYYYTRRFYAGASIPLMADYRIDTVSYDYSFTLSPSYYNIYLTTGGLVVNTDVFKWKPSMLLKYDMETGNMQVDLNTSFILFSDFLWIGASYRTDLEKTGPALIGLLEFTIGDRWSIGYSYDYSLSGLNSYLNGTHEISVRYELFKRIAADNPRYF
jgi:type IX secretion system PorP/SprF family membrane protein